MGIFGHLECSAGRGHPEAFIHAGAGTAAVREVKRCAVCGQITDVLAARIEDGDVVETSGRDRCPDRGSQSLRDARDVEALIDGEDGATAPCPRCQAPLLRAPTGIWD
jgi:hypothetical protein